MLFVPEIEFASIEQSSPFLKPAFSSNITKFKIRLPSGNLRNTVCYFYPSVRFALARFSQVYMINLITVAAKCLYMSVSHPPGNK
jgi:hypothetical protein